MPPSKSLSFLAPSTPRHGIVMLIRLSPTGQRPICRSVACFSSSSVTRWPVHISDKRPRTPSRSSPSLASSISTFANKVSAVNPPESTRPAILQLPEKPSSGAGFTYYFSLGKAYYAFYKTGLKNVYHNYRAAAPIRTQLGFAGYIPTSLPPSSLSGALAFEELVKREGVTRAEFQLLRRSAYDVRRMMPFVLILIVCGEFTPLVVLALGSRVTPLTCRVPKQVEKERRLRLERKTAALKSNGTSVSEEWLNATTLPESITSMVRHASTRDVMRCCAVLGLSKSHLFPPYVPGFLENSYVNWRYRPKLKRWLEYLTVDDALLRAYGGVKGLSVDELRTAIDERGGLEVANDIVIQDEKEMAMRKWLNTWVAGKV